MAIKKNTAFRLITASLLLGGATVLPSAPAHALPSNCTARYDLNTYGVYCGQGTGQFRAKARCYRIGTDNYVTRYGAWKRANGGQRSNAVCYSSEEVASGSWERKD